MTASERARLAYCLFRFYRLFWGMAPSAARQNAALDLADLTSGLIRV